MPFSPQDKENMLVACSRRCCLCHKYCGNKMECAHIEQGRGDDPDNGIPLCLDCHAEIGSYNVDHPKGNKFTATELKRHRDDWYAKLARYPADEHQQQYREADCRTFMQIYRRLPSGWFHQWVGMLLADGSERTSQYEQHFAYSCYISDVHLQFFSLDLAAAVADFNGQFDRFSDVLVHQYSDQIGDFHFYRPKDISNWRGTVDEYNQRHERYVANIRHGCDQLTQAYQEMLDAAGRALPEIVPLEPWPENMINGHV
jgi:hypothetical protein